MAKKTKKVKGSTSGSVQRQYQCMCGEIYTRTRFEEDICPSCGTTDGKRLR